jgi:ethanolamine transporter EutH
MEESKMGFVVFGVVHAVVCFGMLWLAHFRGLSSRLAGAVMTLVFGTGVGANLAYPTGDLTDFIRGLIIGTLFGGILATISLAVIARLKRLG